MQCRLYLLIAATVVSVGVFVHDFIVFWSGQ